MLVRRYVGKRLAEYYNQPSHKVVGAAPDQGLRLSLLLGEWHWRRVYGRLYREQEGQWLTPVELFRPHFSKILANFVSEECRAVSEGVHIVELGGGRGTNANCVLTHLQHSQPELYDRVSYTIVDSSLPLLDLQREMLDSTDHSTKVDFVRQDLMDVAEGRASLLEDSDVQTVVFVMEVLDNLGHDKIRRNRISRRFEQAEIETSDDPLNDSQSGEPASGQLVEVFSELQDPLLSEILETVPSYGGTSLGRSTWVPTVACGVLRHLNRVRPNSSLAVADFDYLPPPDLVSTQKRKSTPAHNEPLITSMDGMDHECYLNAPLFCDILFPTDFSKLASVAKRYWNNDAVVEVMKQSQFLERYGPDEVKATTSWLTGYSPLIHDFGNCSVLTVTNAIDK